jgi:hypothetical protein
MTKPHAPVIFAFVQPAWAHWPAMPFFNATETFFWHTGDCQTVKHSTVSQETIERAGYQVPPEEMAKANKALELERSAVK